MSKRDLELLLNDVLECAQKIKEHTLVNRYRLC